MKGLARALVLKLQRQKVTGKLIENCFTVAFSMAWPLNVQDAGTGFALIQIDLTLFVVKIKCSNAN